VLCFRPTIKSAAKPANHHSETAVCLVEIRFLNDEEKLRNDYKERLAETIDVAILDYLRE